MLDHSPVDSIKERLTIAEVVGSYVKLERAGTNFKARCPFHSERTPSFFVSPSRGTYHCFGCSRGGDIFTFVEEIEGVEFRDALKILADRAGVTLKSVDPKQKSEYDKLYGILGDATSYFEQNLRGNNEALLYLKDRGLTDETIHVWRIGFAKEGWNGLHDTLRKKGHTDVDMGKVGLVIDGERGPYDRFRSRIMFPLSNASGKIVGFSGRIFLPYDKAKEKESAKYVNSPDTVLYNKSHVLYGYDKAKTAMMRENTAVLVEGQMDLLMSHQAGTTNTIALSGTALTEDHLQMIKRFADNLILALDSDDAGFAASERAWRLAISLGIDVKVAQIPKGLDPADFITKDKDSWGEAIKNAKHIIDFLMNSLKERFSTDKRTLRLEASKRVLPYVAEIGNKIDQAHFVGKVANELGINEEHLWEEISKIKHNTGTIPQPIVGKEKKPVFLRKDVITRKILGLILWAEEEGKTKKEQKIDTKKGRESYEELSKEYDLPKLSEIEDTKELIFESEVYYTGHEHLDKELSELLRNLEREILGEHITLAMIDLATAEKTGDLKKADELLKKCQEISKKINEIKNKNI